MATNDNRECPVCGHPLQEDGFCKWCGKKQRFPPPSIHYDPPPSFRPNLPNTIIVKRYEYIDKWEKQTAEFSELWEKGVGLVADVLEDGSIEDFRMLYQFASTAVERSKNIPKIVVEPTEWDKYEERRANVLSTWRATEGVYLGLVDSAQAVLGLIFAIVSLNPNDWKSILDLLMTSGAIYSIVDHYVVLTGCPKLVFEAIFKKSTTPDIVDHIEHENPISKNRGWGYQGPETSELEEMLSSSLSPEEIRDGIIELQKKKIIDERNGRWYIRL